MKRIEPAPGQLDLNALLGDREVRHSLIEKATEDMRVQLILKALDRLCDDPDPKDKAGLKKLGTRLPDGCSQLNVPMPIIAWRLSRTEPTARTYIDIAVSTGLLSVTPSNRTSHTFVIHWPRIFEPGSSDQGSNQSGSDQSNDSVSPATGRHVDHTVRHVKRSPGSQGRLVQTVRQGESQGEKQGESLGANSQLSPSVFPPPVLKPGSSISNVINPGFQTGTHSPCPKTSVRGKARGKIPSKDRPTWRPRTDADGRDQTLLFGLKAIIASCDVRNPEQVRMAFLRCVEIGAVDFNSRQRMIDFFAEAECDIDKSTIKSGGILKENLFQNRRYANLAQIDRAVLKVNTLQAVSKDDQLERLRERAATGVYSPNG